MCLVGGAGRKARTVTHYKQLPGNLGRPGLPSPIRKFGARGNGLGGKERWPFSCNPAPGALGPRHFPLDPRLSSFPVTRLPTSGDPRPGGGG